MNTATRRVKVSELKVGDRIRFRRGADESWQIATVCYVPEKLTSALRGGHVRVRTDVVQPDGNDRAIVLSKTTIEIID